MKHIFKNITSVFLALVFLISSSGFFIYEHYCNTQNTSEVSFLIESFNCHHNHENNHTDCDDNSICCTTSKLNIITEKKCVTDKKSCCETKKRFYKLKSVFEKPLIKNTFLVISKIIILYKNIVDVDDDNNSNKLDAKPDLKIHLLSGKKLVYLLHQQKVAPPVF